jgi:hypothetical protein
LLLNKDAAKDMQQELARVSAQLGEPGASKRAAKLAMEMVAAGMIPRD